MKKNLLGIMTFLSIAILILTGCGSTSSKGGGSTISTMTAAMMQENHIVTEVQGTAFTLSLPFTKKVDSDYRVEFSDFGLDVSGCYIADITFAPEKLVLDGAFGIQRTLEISGSFKQKCTVRGYTLVAQQRIVNLKDNNAKSGKVSASYSYGTPSEDGYELMNLPYEMDITEYKRYQIDFQFMHNGIVVGGQNVMIKAFPDQYGTVSSHFGGTMTEPTDTSSQMVVTDADGKGRFLYSPPAVFPSPGTTYDLELVAYEDDTNTTILVAQKIQLRFNLKPGASTGQATTLSIVYGAVPPKSELHEEGQWDSEGKILNYYAVHAVNEDSQRPIVGVPITMTLINNVKKLNGKKLKTETGKITNGTPVQFSDNTVNFLDSALSPSQRVENRDKLIILPSEGKTDPSYLGGWNIDEVYMQSLMLSGIYSNILSEKDLTYVIGNERRLLGRNIAVADVQAIDLESITDEYGMAYFKVTFDPELTGHTIALEAHTESDIRVGITRIVKLMGLGISGFSEIFQAVENSGEEEEVSMELYVKVNSVTYPLIDLNIDPSSFSIDEGSSNCELLKDKSDFHTSSTGEVQLVVQTDGNTSETGGVDECIIKWKGDEDLIEFEY